MQVLHGLGVQVDYAVAAQGQGVDGQVAAAQIRFRAAAVQRHAFPATPEADVHAVPHHIGVRMRGQKFLCAAVKGKIQFNGGAAQQHVTHGAAHEVELHGQSVPEFAV